MLVPVVPVGTGVTEDTPESEIARELTPGEDTLIQELGVDRDHVHHEFLIAYKITLWVGLKWGKSL